MVSLPHAQLSRPARPLPLVVRGTGHAQPALRGVVAATMLINVVVPHVPGAGRARGYAPWLVTAVTLVLPATDRYLPYLDRL